MKWITDTAVKILSLQMMTHEHHVLTNLLDKRHCRHYEQMKYKEDNDPILGDLQSISTQGFLCHWLEKWNQPNAFSEHSATMTLLWMQRPGKTTAWFHQVRQQQSPLEGKQCRNPGSQCFHLHYTWKNLPWALQGKQRGEVSNEEDIW